MAALNRKGMALTTAERSRRWRKKHPDQHRKNVAKYNCNLRRRVLTHFGGKCSKCGIDEWRVLQIDHVNGGGNSHRRDWRCRGAPFYIQLLQLKDHSSYQILCANCNQLKRYENYEYRKEEF